MEARHKRLPPPPSIHDYHDDVESSGPGEKKLSKTKVTVDKKTGKLHILKKSVDCDEDETFEGADGDVSAKEDVASDKV